MQYRVYSEELHMHNRAAAQVEQHERRPTQAKS